MASCSFINSTVASENSVLQLSIARFYRGKRKLCAAIVYRKESEFVGEVGNVCEPQTCTCLVVSERHVNVFKTLRNGRCVVKILHLLYTAFGILYALIARAGAVNVVIAGNDENGVVVAKVARYYDGVIAARYDLVERAHNHRPRNFISLGVIEFSLYGIVRIIAYKQRRKIVKVAHYRHFILRLLPAAFFTVAGDKDAGQSKCENTNQNK